jgi:hypothetical protein
MALSRIDTTNMIEDVPQSKLDNNVNFRNIIINGDMSIAQRGTSTASVSSGATFPALDRFKFYVSSGGTWTVSQDTDVPSGQGFAKSLKMDNTTANGSLSSGSLAQIQQGIEGQNLQYLKKGTSNAESVTLSFWVKSNKTGTYICEIRDTDNSRSISKSYTISSASTWEKKTITFDGDTTGTLNNDNDKSLELVWWLLAGTDFTSGTLQTSWGSQTNANRAVGQVNLADSTSNEWYITGVQLEAGTTASDFEFLPHDVNLERCQRYFWKSYEIGDAPGSAPKLNSVIARFVDATTSYGSIQVPYVNLRANPTKTIYSPQSGATGKLISDNLVDINANSESISSHGGGWIYAGAVSISGGTSCRAHLTLDAEL